MVAAIDSEWLFHNLGLKEGTVKDVEGTNIGNCFRIMKGSKLVKNSSVTHNVAPDRFITNGY